MRRFCVLLHAVILMTVIKSALHTVSITYVYSSGKKKRENVFSFIIFTEFGERGIGKKKGARWLCQTVLDNSSTLGPGEFPV